MKVRISNADVVVHQGSVLRSLLVAGLGIGAAVTEGKQSRVMGALALGVACFTFAYDPTPPEQEPSFGV